MSEAVDPIFAVAVSMTSSEAIATVNAINNALDKIDGETWAIWYELDKLSGGEVVEGGIRYAIDDFIDTFVKAADVA